MDLMNVAMDIQTVETIHVSGGGRLWYLNPSRKVVVLDKASAMTPCL